jgi:hypothetical protein
MRCASRDVRSRRPSVRRSSAGLKTCVYVCQALLLAGAAVVAQERPSWRVEIAGAGAAADDSAADVPAPSLRNVPNDGYAQVTLAPWVESNGWRFQRGVQRARYRALPRGTAGLALAEAFAFNVDVVLYPTDEADREELTRLLPFLRAHERSPMPPLANFGVIDDGSPEMGEALNMLMRRNLLYRIVSTPDPALAFTIQPGSGEFPRPALANPSDFAARVREKLGDDKRLVRLFGTTTTIARLTGDGRQARLVLLSYSRNRTQQDVRVRLLGRYQPTAFAAYGALADARLGDVALADGATEFTLPFFSTIAIVDFSG